MTKEIRMTKSEGASMPRTALFDILASLVISHWSLVIQNDSAQAFSPGETRCAQTLPHSMLLVFRRYFLFFGGGVNTGPLEGACSSGRILVSLVWAMVRR